MVVGDFNTVLTKTDLSTVAPAGHRYGRGDVGMWWMDIMLAPWHLVATERYVLASPHTGNQTIYGRIAEWDAGVRRETPRKVSSNGSCFYLLYWAGVGCYTYKPK